MIGRRFGKSVLFAPCRHIAGRAALDTPFMGAVDSDSRATAQLSRLIGLAASDLDQHLFEAALSAMGALCDFNAG